MVQSELRSNGNKGILTASSGEVLILEFHHEMQLAYFKFHQQGCFIDI